MTPARPPCPGAGRRAPCERLPAISVTARAISQATTSKHQREVSHARRPRRAAGPRSRRRSPGRGRFGRAASGWAQPADQCRQSERMHQPGRFVTGQRAGIAPDSCAPAPSAARRAPERVEVPLRRTGALVGALRAAGGSNKVKLHGVGGHGRRLRGRRVGANGREPRRVSAEAADRLRQAGRPLSLTIAPAVAYAATLHAHESSTQCRSAGRSCAHTTHSPAACRSRRSFGRLDHRASLVRSHASAARLRFLASNTRRRASALAASRHAAWRTDSPSPSGSIPADVARPPADRRRKVALRVAKDCREKWRPPLLRAPSRSIERQGGGPLRRVRRQRRRASLAASSPSPSTTRRPPASDR